MLSRTHISTISSSVWGMSLSIITIYSFLLHSDIMETSQKGNGVTSMYPPPLRKKESKQKILKKFCQLVECLLNILFPQHKMAAGK